MIGFLGGEAADALAANVAAFRKGLDQSARYATLAASTDKVEGVPPGEMRPRSRHGSSW